MSILVGVRRISAVFALGVISLTGSYAQTDQTSDSGKTCADVTPPAIDPADNIANVPVYVIPKRASGHQAVCRAKEALAAGMVAIEFNKNVILARALGDPSPADDIGEVSDFPYSEPGSTPKPGSPPPGPVNEEIEHAHFYAAFVDPATGVEYTLSSVADGTTDVDTDAVEWITSTVAPLLTKPATQASALAQPRLAVTESGSASYDPRAWTKVIDATIGMPNNKMAEGSIRGHGRRLGASGAIVHIFRLNGGSLGNDYYLVDTAYTQTPDWNPFDYWTVIFRTQVDAWASKSTQLTLTASSPNTTPVLADFAPKTPISSSTQTLQVGLGISASGPSVSAEYSVTTTQQSVDTAVQGTITSNTVKWTDTYNGFGNVFMPKPPSSLTSTFSGERLAIFRVPQGAGLQIAPHLYSQVQASITDFILVPVTVFENADWSIQSKISVPGSK
jgi:hypothetical protein